jgi:hypothetical protein
MKNVLPWRGQSPKQLTSKELAVCIARLLSCGVAAPLADKP